MLLYKILDGAAWAGGGDAVPWAAVDRADGYVHLSAAHQLQQTAAKHFAGRRGLVLVAIDGDRLVAGTLRWEVSRGGDSFPHVYGDIPRAAVVSVTELPDDGADFEWPA